MAGRPSPSDVDRCIGARLREARISRRISQAALGEQLGLTFQQIQKYESGKNRVSAGMLYRAASVLNVPITFFFEQLSPKPVQFDREMNSDVLTFLSSSEGLKLSRSFSQIGDRKVRGALLRLAETIAGEENQESEPENTT